jgi:hypothetical protein
MSIINTTTAAVYTIARAIYSNLTIVVPLFSKLVGGDFSTAGLRDPIPLPYIQNTSVPHWSSHRSSVVSGWFTIKPIPLKNRGVARLGGLVKL